MADFRYIWPTSPGQPNSVLTTDGAGNLSWVVISDSGSGSWGNADTLDGYHATDFLLATANFDGRYLLINGQAVDSALLSGHPASFFALATHNHDAIYLKLSDIAADSNLLQGHPAIDFALANHTHTNIDAVTLQSHPASDFLLKTDPLEADTGFIQIGATAGLHCIFRYDGTISFDNVNWYTIWNSGKMGAGSGLDADTIQGHTLSDIYSGLGYNATTLNGHPASDFALASHNHDTVYLKIGATAANSLLFGGYAPSYFALASHNHDSRYLQTNGVTYVMPISQGVANSVLSNDGNGNLTWSTSAPGTHNALNGIQGGTTNQYFHLTYAQYNAYGLHNSLTDLQGGTTGQYFHLTQSQLSALTGNGICDLHNHDNKYLKTNGITYVMPASQGAANTMLVNDGSGNLTWNAFVSAHNALSGLQGGTTNQYYHLTSSDYTMLTTGVEATNHKHDTKYLKLDGTAAMTGNLTVNGNITTSGQLVSNTTTLPPFTVASNLLINNLNAEFLGGLDNSAFSLVGHNHNGVYMPTNGVSYFMPASQGAAGTFLKNDGMGNLTWVAQSTTSTVNAFNELDINDASGSYTTGIRGGIGQSSNIIWKLPLLQGVSHSVLMNDGSGNLSWYPLIKTDVSVTYTGTGFNAGTFNETIVINGAIQLQPSSSTIMYNYVQTHTITNSGSIALTDYQVYLNCYNYNGTSISNTFYTNGHLLKSDYTDIYITLADGVTQVPFWIEYTSPNAPNSTQFRLWIKVSLPASGSTTIKIFYGNATATSYSSGSNTFDFFDNFTNTTIDSNKWTYTNGVSLNNITINAMDGTVSIPTNGVLTATSTFTQSQKMFVKWATSSYNAGQVPEISINGRLTYWYYTGGGATLYYWNGSSALSVAPSELFYATATYLSSVWMDNTHQYWQRYDDDENTQSVVTVNTSSYTGNVQFSIGNFDSNTLNVCEVFVTKIATTSLTHGAWTSESISLYPMSGTWISPAIPLDSVETAEYGLLSFNYNTPSGTSIILYTSIDGQATWQQMNPDDSIASIVSRLSCTGKSIYIKIKFTTAVPDTPSISLLNIFVKSTTLYTVLSILDSSNTYTTTIIGGTQTANINLILPPTQGAANTYLINDGIGNLSWGTVIQTHNALNGLQGGATGQYYHLTSSDYTMLTTGIEATNHKHDTKYLNTSGVTYSMINVQGAPNTFLMNDGHGNLTWSAATLNLPNQSGNAGKYLTTDGNGNLSWATVSGGSGSGTDLPDQSGQGGKFLTTDGAGNLSWAVVANTGTPTQLIHLDTLTADWNNGTYTSNITTANNQLELITFTIDGIIFNYGRSHTIIGTNIDLTNYQIKLNLYNSTTTGNEPADTLYLNGHVQQSNWNDIRFTDVNGNVLSYWLDPTTTSAHAVVWVKMLSIPANINSVLNIFYGNSTCSGQSDAANTMMFYDDFTTSQVGSVYSENANNAYPAGRYTATHTATTNGWHIAQPTALDTADELTCNTMLSGPSICTVTFAFTNKTGNSQILRVGYAGGSHELGLWSGQVINWNDNNSSDTLTIQWTDGTTSNNISIYNSAGSLIYTGSQNFGNTFRPLPISDRQGSSATIDLYVKNFYIVQYTANPPTHGTSTAEIASLSGIWYSPAIPLDVIGVTVSSSITWTADTPTYTSVLVETSLDNLNWTQCTNNGQVINGIENGVNCIGKMLWYRYTLTTSVVGTTPIVTSTRIEIHGETENISCAGLNLDTTNGYETVINVRPQTASITYVLPASQGLANTVMTNDGSGNLSWNSFAHNILNSLQGGSSALSQYYHLSLIDYTMLTTGVEATNHIHDTKYMNTRGITYVMPTVQGLINAYLVNDGSGNLTWKNLNQYLNTTSGATFTGLLNITGESSFGDIITLAGNLSAGTKGHIGMTDNTGTTLSLSTNISNSIIDSSVLASWQMVMRGTADNFELIRYPSGSTTAISMLKIDNAGNITSMNRTIWDSTNLNITNYLNTNGITYTMPNTQGMADTVLTNDGNGNLTWQTKGSTGAGNPFSEIDITDASGLHETILKTATQAANITYFLPPAQGAATTYLTNDGTGHLTWEVSNMPPVSLNYSYNTTSAFGAGTVNNAVISNNMISIASHGLYGYTYMKTHLINGSADGVLTDYVIKINLFNSTGTDSNNNLYLNTHARTDWSDLLICLADESNTVLSFFLDPASTAAQAIVWVKIPSIPANPETITIAIYYGNNAATSLSDGTATFQLYDDFSLVLPDTSKWYVYSGIGNTVRTNSSALQLVKNNANGCGIQSVNSYDYPIAVSYRAKLASVQSAQMGILLTDTDRTTTANAYFAGYASAGQIAVYNADTYTASNIVTSHVAGAPSFLSTMTSAGWGYYTPIQIVGSPDGDLTNYTIKIVADPEGTYIGGNQVGLNENCINYPIDITFTDASGNELSYWISTSNFDIYIKVPSIPQATGALIYMFYGNPNTANSDSSGENTFTFFDDFQVANTNKWTMNASTTDGSDGTGINYGGSGAEMYCPSNQNCFIQLNTPSYNVNDTEVGFAYQCYVTEPISNSGAMSVIYNNSSPWGGGIWFDPVNNNSDTLRFALDNPMSQGDYSNNISVTDNYSEIISARISTSTNHITIYNNENIVISENFGQYGADSYYIYMGGTGNSSDCTLYMKTRYFFIRNITVNEPVVNASSCIASTSTDYAHSGVHSYKVQSTISDVDCYVQLGNFQLNANTTYTVSMWVYSPNNTYLQLGSIGIIEGQGQNRFIIPAGSGDVALPANTWTPVTATGVTPSDWAASPINKVVLRPAKINGATYDPAVALYYDDILITNTGMVTASYVNNVETTLTNVLEPYSVNVWDSFEVTRNGNQFTYAMNGTVQATDVVTTLDTATFIAMPQLWNSNNSDIAEMDIDYIAVRKITQNPPTHGSTITEESAPTVAEWTSLPLSLISVGILQTSSITWTDTLPLNTVIDIYTSIDNTTWQLCTKDQSIPNMTFGTDCTFLKLQVKVVLTSYDGLYTPNLNSLTISLGGKMSFTQLNERMSVIENMTFKAGTVVAVDGNKATVQCDDNTVVTARILV